MAQQVKNLPAMQEIQEMWVQFLGQEDPLKKEMATCSSILAWKTPWTEEPGGLQTAWLHEPPGKPKNTGVGSLFLLQQIFPTQESNRGLQH